MAILLWRCSVGSPCRISYPPSRATDFATSILVGLSLLCTSFQVIPALRLERHLRFDRLTIVEVAQALAYNVAAVGLAWKGLGAMSFALALLLRSVIGAALANLVCPWPIGWRWDWARVRQHLRFGLPYQGSNFISLLKDSIFPVYIGLLLGAAEVGYLNWAGMIANYPVLALTVLQRLYLPAFSRMQLHRAHLVAFVEQILRATNALVAPFAVITLVLIHPIIHLIFGDKWLVAVPYFYLFWVANCFVATVTPLTGLLNALGHSRTVFGFAILWMSGTWLLGVPLSLWLGGIGLAIANLAVGFTGIVLIRITQQFVPFRVVPLIVPIWAWGAVLGMAMYLMQRIMPPNGLGGLACYGILGFAVYGVGLLALHPAESRRAWDWLRRQQWNRVSRSSSIP